MTEAIEFPVLPAVAPIATPQYLNGLHTFTDMFCGIGGFHIAASSLGMECVFACDIDVEVRRAFWKNCERETAHSPTLPTGYCRNRH